MDGTSPARLRIIHLIILVLTASSCPVFSEDIKGLVEKAKKGDARAQFNLGFAYAHGRGVRQDHSEAAKWYRKAAEQGYAMAQSNFGVAYAHGQGVPQDHSEAAKWYRKAAEQEDPMAQYNLGVAYAHGQGVPQDHVFAYFWFSLSASRSTGEHHVQSAKSRDIAAASLTPDQLMKAQRMTREWDATHPRH